MPNWVYNVMKVSGNAEELKNFRASAEDKKEKCLLSFERLNPTPPAFLEDEQGITPKWYAWRLANWGCKWDASDVEREEITHHKKQALLYRFITPWSPPVEFLRTLGKLYPLLTFSLHYEEEAKMYPDGVINVKGRSFKENILKF